MPRAVAQRGPRNLIRDLQSHAVAGAVGAATGLAQQHATNLGVNLVERLNRGLSSAKELFDSYGVEYTPVNGPAANTRSAQKRIGEPIAQSTPNKQAPPENQEMASASNDETMPMVNGEANTGPSTTATEFSNVQVIASPLSTPTPQQITYKKQRRFTVNVQSASNKEFPPLKTDGQTLFCDDDWNIIPWKSSAFYMNPAEHVELHLCSSKFRVVKMSYKMSNFTAHTGNVTAGGPSLNMHYGGIGFDSLMIGQRELGVHSIRNKAEGLSQTTHASVGQYMNQSGFMEYPWHLRYYADGVLQHPAWGTQVELRNLEKHCLYQLGSPAISSGTFIPPEKKWFTSQGLRGRAQLMDVGTGGSIADKGGFANIHPFISGWIAQQGVGYTPASEKKMSCPNDGQRTIWRDVHFNTCQAEAAPLCFFQNDRQAEQQPPEGNRVGTQGNGTFMDTPVIAFRPCVPPTPDGSDPNIMISFVLESEMTVEYIPLIGDSSMSFGATHNVYHVTDEQFNVEPDNRPYGLGINNYLNMKINGINDRPSAGVRTDQWKDVPLHDQQMDVLAYNGPLGNDLVSITRTLHGYVNQAGHPI